MCWEMGVEKGLVGHEVVSIKKHWGSRPQEAQV